MAGREDRERSEELEVRQSVLYAVGCICDGEGVVSSMSDTQLPSHSAAHVCRWTAQEQQRERAVRPKPAPTKETLALLADLAFKQTEGWLIERDKMLYRVSYHCVAAWAVSVLATELQFFASHANRKVIKSEDVVLCARKLPAMVRIPSSGPLLCITRLTDGSS